MNIEAMNKTIEAIKASQAEDAETKFALETFHDHRRDEAGHVCGTIACIAGFAIAGNNPTLWADVKTGIDEGTVDSGIVQFLAAHELGINQKQADELFCSERHRFTLNNVTPETAIEVLERVMASEDQSPLFINSIWDEKLRN